MHLTKLWLASALVLTLAACATSAAAPPASVSRVVSTTSFGMCVGYCTTTLEITEGQAVLTREARGGRGVPNPSQTPQRYSMPLTPAEWQEIQRLAAAADLDALPDVVGCPDCADGGAESLAIEGPAGSDRVQFEFRATLPQAQPLLDRVRALRAQLTPEDGD